MNYSYCWLWVSNSPVLCQRQHAFYSHSLTVNDLHAHVVRRLKQFSPVPWPVGSSVWGAGAWRTILADTLFQSSLQEVPCEQFWHGQGCLDRAAKEALEKEPIADLMPFSVLKPLTAKYIHQVWQKEWDEAIVVSNKLHEILPKLSGKLLTFCNTRKEDSSK